MDKAIKQLQRMYGAGRAYQPANAGTVTSGDHCGRASPDEGAVPACKYGNRSGRHSEGSDGDQNTM